MDAYLKLEWSKHHRRSELRLLESFAIDFSRYEEDIFNLHINETDPVHQLGDVYTDDHGGPLQYPVDPRTGAEVRQLVVESGKTWQLYDQFPSGSNLKRADHQHCLAVLNRLNMRLGFESAEEKEALAKYGALTGKLKHERMLFDSFVRNYFNNSLVGRKRTIDKELDGLVVAIWKDKVREMLGRKLADSYRISTAVMWLMYKRNERNVQFEPVTEDVLELGMVRNIFTENLLHTTTLKRGKRVLDKFLDEYNQTVGVEDAMHVDTVLRQDEDVRFVINSGALTYLLGTMCEPEQRWMMPFRIRTIGNRNVIFIEKKLQPVKMLTHDRNVKAHKYLVRSFMTFAKKDITKSTEKTPETQSTISSQDVEFKAVEFDEYLRLAQERATTNESYQKSTCLQLWKLQDNDDQYRFLVRSRADCYESLRKMKFFINISIKLEYQPEFGAEQMTKSELVREWSRQLLRPNSKTLRLRINAMTHAILSHRYLELKDIEEELKRLYKIEPRNLITNLWQTLKLLMHFPAGEHMMQHDSKNSETIMILSGITKESTFPTALDLPHLYSNIEYDRCALEEYDWIPIDKTVITKLHREHTLLPGTFPHWTHRQRLLKREKLKPNPKPEPPKPLEKQKKKKSKAKRVRRKERDQQKKQQQKFVSQVQQSLDQFAPYAGPSNKMGMSPTGLGKVAKPSYSPVSFPKKETFDYQAYVNQANARNDD